MRFDGEGGCNPSISSRSPGLQVFQSRDIRNRSPSRPFTDARRFGPATASCSSRGSLDVAGVSGHPSTRQKLLDIQNTVIFRWEKNCCWAGIMIRILSIFVAIGLPSVLGAATLADPPKNTGIAFKISKVERGKEGDTGFELLVVNIANESTSDYWIMSSDKDSVERHLRGNPEALVYMLHHSYTADHDEHHHVRQDGHWQRTHPLDFRPGNTRWIKLGPSEQKEIRIPVVDTLVGHAARVALSMYFSRDAEGQKSFYLVTKPVIIKAQQGSPQSATRSESDLEGGDQPQPKAK